VEYREGTMRVEFYRPDDEEQQAIATAVWDGRHVVIECDDDELAGTIARIYRKTPVVTDDASYRRLGTHGDVVIQPSDLEWFRAATQARSQREAGLVPRFVAGSIEGGFDPASNYRRFSDQMHEVARRAPD
jgi:hypothetical protein